KEQLMLIDVSTMKVSKTILLREKPKGQRLLVDGPFFRPDGKVAAVITRLCPEQPGTGDLEVEDMPQPRIHLVDVAAGQLRETLISPPCFASSACFSPDGKTLATDGHGRVLLWDLTEPLGSRTARSKGP